MILCDGTDTKERVADFNDPHRDALAVVLDHAAGHHDRHDECWIVGTPPQYAEFFGRRILFSGKYSGQGHVIWSRRCDNAEQARQVAADAFGVTVDEMVVR